MERVAGAARARGGRAIDARGRDGSEISSGFGGAEGEDGEEEIVVRSERKLGWRRSGIRLDDRLPRDALDRVRRADDAVLLRKGRVLTDVSESTSERRQRAHHVEHFV